MDQLLTRLGKTVRVKRKMSGPAFTSTSDSKHTILRSSKTMDMSEIGQCIDFPKILEEGGSSSSSSRSNSACSDTDDGRYWKEVQDNMTLTITLGTGSEKRVCELLNLVEVLGFCFWVFVFVSLLFLAILLWVMFFQYVIRPEDTSDKIKYGLIWFAMFIGTTLLRFITHRNVSSGMKNVLDHAEIFIATSLVMVFGANMAFYLHTPMNSPLKDLGFMLIPEQDIDSIWRSMSDMMTIFLPIVCAVQSIFMTRENRCKVFVSFFRLMTVCYALRTLTVPLTSLPGPAPHCRPEAHNYSPPDNWIDIVTRVGPMHGKFNTCGDLLFSGHMCYTSSALLLYLRQLDRRFRKGRTLRWVLGLLYLGIVALLCIAGRKHYTVDIVLGIIISFMVFFHFEHGWVPPALYLDPPKHYDALPQQLSITTSLQDNYTRTSHVEDPNYII